MLLIHSAKRFLKYKLRMAFVEIKINIDIHVPIWENK
jgi:hypothetical protein